MVEPGIKLINAKTYGASEAVEKLCDSNPNHAGQIRDDYILTGRIGDPFPDSLLRFINNPNYAGILKEIDDLNQY